MDEEVAQILKKRYDEADKKSKFDKGQTLIKYHIEYVQRKQYNPLMLDNLKSALTVFFELKLYKKYVDGSLDNSLDVITVIEKLIYTDCDYSRLILVKLLVEKVRQQFYDCSKHLNYLDEAIKHYLQLAKNSKCYDSTYHGLDVAYETAIIICKKHKLSQEIKYHQGFVNHLIMAAEMRYNLDDFKVAASFYEEAWEYCGKNGKFFNKEERTNLHKKHLEAQEKGAQNIISTEVVISLEEEMSEIIARFEATEDAFSALHIYSNFYQAVSPEKIKVPEEDSAARFIPAKFIDREGKTISEGGEREIYYKTIIESQSSVLKHTLDIIRKKYDLNHEFWLNFLQDKSFIPKERQELVAEALHLGFINYMSAFSHIILPQLEFCFRKILKEMGEITSKIDLDSGQQEEKTLEWCLKNTKLEEVFDKDLIADLVSFLTTKPIAFRHQILHGRLNKGQIDLYGNRLYWLIIKMLYSYKTN